jgi:pimeloyl-ACP methyl ester carboxylesterase
VQPEAASADPIATETRTIAGIRTFVRRRAGAGVPTIFVHGNPTHSGDWVPFMHALDGPSIAFDLPCFGRSERVGPERFAATMGAYGDFVASALDELGVGEHKLVVHDWGAVGLIAAQRDPEAVKRLVVINAVPLSGGYRWHWVARIWRRRGLGELFGRATTRTALAMLLRLARPRLRPMPREFVDSIWEHWDPGMAAAVLRLYRSADPTALAAAGSRLESLDCPALVVWGGSDPYIGAEHGRVYAARLGGAAGAGQAELIELSGAGHWPWIDRPELVGRVAGFLGED